MEDEAPVAVTMSFMLTRAGCETEVAGTRDEAILKVQTSKFDLITLDVSMPDVNGFILCAELRLNPRLRDVPIVFISGRASLEDQQRGLDVGAVDYITKPFGANEFVPRILSHIKSNLAHA
ncbi:MAG: response regulator [Limisphaerales bacterium]